MTVSPPPRSSTTCSSVSSAGSPNSCSCPVPTFLPSRKCRAPPPHTPPPLLPACILAAQLDAACCFRSLTALLPLQGRPETTRWLTTSAATTATTPSRSVRHRRRRRSPPPAARGCRPIAPGCRGADPAARALAGYHASLAQGAFFDQLDPTVVTTFYDSVCGVPLFRAPVGRTFGAPLLSCRSLPARRSRRHARGDSRTPLAASCL